MLSIPASRTLWYDALRAFLALGVAYHHTVPVSENALGYLNDMLVVARVPCFYFLAGRFLGKALVNVDSRIAFAQIAMRFRRLIIPAVLFLLLVDLSKIHALMFLSFHENFFLSSLFWSTTLVTLIVYLCKTAGIYRYRGVVLGLLTAASIIMLWLYSHLNIPLFDFNCTLHSIMFVSAGYCVGNGYIRIPRFMRSKLSIAAAIIIYVAIVLFNPMAYFSESLQKAMHRIILPFIGIYGIFGMFYIMRKWISHDNVWGQIAYYIGQRSLPLYVLIWVSISWIDFHALMPPMTPEVCQSVIVFILATAASLFLHDMLCLIPGVEGMVFGRKRKLQNPLQSIFQRHKTVNQETA